MTALAWLGALIIGLTLGLLGAGGSIVTVPVLVYLLHQPDKTAIAGSLAIVGGIATAGAVMAAARRRIDWRSVLLFGGAGVPGASLGAWLARFVPGSVQLAVFAVVMLTAAWFMARSRPVETSRPGCQRCGLLIVSEGAAVGALTGFVGVGGGFLIVPALMLLARLPMDRAIGSSLAIIAMNSWTGLALSLGAATGAGSIDWELVGTFIAIGIAGSLAGQSVSHRISPPALKMTFAVALLLVGGFIVTRSILEMR